MKLYKYDPTRASVTKKFLEFKLLVETMDIPKFELKLNSLTQNNVALRRFKKNN